MSLPGQQLDRISNAIRGVHTRDSLARLLHARLDVRLDDVTDGENFTAVVFNLVGWADRIDRLPELVRAALAENPSNPDLAAVAAELGISQPPGSAPLAVPIPWYVPFERNPAFVGRTEDLERLHAALAGLTKDGGQAAVGIRPVGATGMGGMGKTQLAVEYAYRHRADYPAGVFWLNAAGDWQAEFAALGTYLEPSRAGEPQEAQIRAAADYLQAHPNCLLVLDNVEDPQQLRRPLTRFLLPAALPCAVLFTTRRHDLGGFRPVELPVLPLEPGLRLLLRHPSREPVLAEEQPEHGEAVQIYEVLGGLPLALEIAGAHLGRRPAGSLRAYREELLRRGALAVVDDRRGGVRDVDLGTRHAAAVAAALAEQWEGLGEDARLLLRAAGELPEAAIPLARLGLLVGLAEGDGDFFGTPLGDAAGELVDASLLEELRGDLVRLHPLVREYAAQQTRPAEQERFRWESAARLIGAYDDLAVLEGQCARRGIDAVERDLVTGLWLLGDAGASGPIGAAASQLLRAVRQESHTLRGWSVRKAPDWFRQQWLKRAMVTKGASGSRRERTFLDKLPGPHLEVIWTTAQSTTSLVRTLTGHAGRVWAVAVTLDGRHVISGAGDNTLRVWDLATGDTVRIFSGHTGWIWAVAVTSDGRRVVSGSGDNTLRVWDLTTGETVRILTGHTNEVRAVTVTPDGRYVISGSDDNTLRVWDLATGETVRTLTGHTNEVRAVTMTPDSRYVISGSDDSNVQIWDLNSREPARILQGHTGAVRAVALTLDGSYAISGSRDNTLRLWNLATGETVRIFSGHRGWVYGIAVTPDGHRVVSSSYDNTLRVWDVQTGSCTQILSRHAGPVNAVAVTPDGNHAISASDDNTLRVWDLYTDGLQETFGAHNHRVWATAVTPDGRLAVSGSGDNTLRVWELTSGDSLYTLWGHSRGVWATAVTPNGRYAVSGSADNTLRMWDINTGKAIRTFSGHAGWVWGVAVTPDGRNVVSGSADSTLRVWDLDTGKTVRTLIGHVGPVYAVAVTPDGRHAISGSEDNTLRMWDLRTSKTVRTLSGHVGSVYAVAVTPDGRHAISGSEDHTLQMRDLHTGKTVRTFGGHVGRVWAIAMTTDGNCVVSGSSDTTLRVWNVLTGVEAAQIILDAPVYCVAIAPNSPTLVAGDGAGNLWCLRYRDLSG